MIFKSFKKRSFEREIYISNLMLNNALKNKQT